MKRERKKKEDCWCNLKKKTERETNNVIIVNVFF